MKRTTRLRISLLLLLAGLGGATKARAQANSDEPAPLIVYPYIAVDRDQGIDTWIQLTNVVDDPINVRCFYEQTVAECIDGEPGQSCDPLRSTCTGLCVPELRRKAFALQLTQHQPIAWRASFGLAALPLSGAVGPGGQTNGASQVPPIGDGPTTSTLRCTVVGPDFVQPTAENALVGLATITRRSGTIQMPEADASQYRAIGARTFSDRLDGDALLHLGGTGAEYEACPAYNILEHYYDGSPVRVGEQTANISTTLVLVPCTTPEGAAVAQFLVHNEFGQRFSTSRPIDRQFVTPISSIDTTQPNRSIFSVGLGGTLGARTSIQGLGSGLHMLGIESHRDRETDIVHTAAVEVHGYGQRLDGDVIVFRAPECTGDCNRNGEVALHEVITSVGIGSGAMPIDLCIPADRDGNRAITIDEMVSSVASTLEGCPQAEPPPTPASSPAAPTAPTVNGGPSQSIGPEITHFGLATADDRPLEPETTDAEGRPVYVRPFGQGFTFVIEASRGASQRPVARSTYNEKGSAPDLQVLVSRALGDGNPDVCEEDGRSGGVAAAPDLDFTDPEAAAAMNDLGCRAFDRFPGAEAVCTRSNGTRAGNAGPFAPVSERPEVQFCIPIARAWSLPEGDTIIAARVPDIQGSFGEVREIVVRVEE